MQASRIGATTFSIMPLSRMTHLKDAQKFENLHDNTQDKHTQYNGNISSPECHSLALYAECHSDECHSNLMSF